MKPAPDEYFIWDLNSKSPKTNGMNVKDLQYWIQEQEKTRRCRFF